MIRWLSPSRLVRVAAIASVVLWGRAAIACVGDCSGNGVVSAGELTKIVSIINLCSGAAQGCAAVPGTDKQCAGADRNGNGVISAGELTFVISNIINFPGGCPPAATSTPTTTAVAASPSPTPTPTPSSAATCGNGFIEAGENCVSCPADCEVKQCSLATPAPTVAFRVNWTPPAGAEASSTTVLVGYRSDRVSLPGSGAAPTGRVKNKPSNSIVTVNDQDYALRVVVTRSSTIPTGRLFTVDFDRCAGVPVATTADFGCVVEGCASSFGDIQGCTCAVTAP